jgi:hypothetical protein
VGMPSKAVDTAWHEFILHTRAYAQWCDIAFGKLLHHTPAEALGTSTARNDGLRRAWVWACKEDGIPPNEALSLPLLFAIDAKLEIEGGYRYLANCRDIRRASTETVYCGTDFAVAPGSEKNSGDGGGFTFSSDASDLGGGDGDGGGCGGD